MYMFLMIRSTKIEFDDVVFHTLPHMNDETIALGQIEFVRRNRRIKKIL